MSGNEEDAQAILDLRRSRSQTAMASSSEQADSCSSSERQDAGGASSSSSSKKKNKNKNKEELQVSDEMLDDDDDDDDAAGPSSGGAHALEPAAAGLGGGEEDSDDENDDGGSAKKKKAKPRRWTDAEDAALCAGVEKYGERRWKAIASGVGTRDHMQCLQRWKKVLKRGLVKEYWTADEDDVIREAVAAEDVEGRNVDWHAVAAKLPLRSARECRERYKYALGSLAAHRKQGPPSSSSENLSPAQFARAMAIQNSPGQQPPSSGYLGAQHAQRAPPPGGRPYARGGLMTPSLSAALEPPRCFPDYGRSPPEPRRLPQQPWTTSPGPGPRDEGMANSEIEARLAQLQAVVETSGREIFALKQILAQRSGDYSPSYSNSTASTRELPSPHQIPHSSTGAHSTGGLRRSLPSPEKTDRADGETWPPVAYCHFETPRDDHFYLPPRPFEHPYYANYPYPPYASSSKPPDFPHYPPKATPQDFAASCAGSSPHARPPLPH